MVDSKANKRIAARRERKKPAESTSLITPVSLCHSAPVLVVGEDAASFMVPFEGKLDELGIGFSEWPEDLLSLFFRVSVSGTTMSFGYGFSITEQLTLIPIGFVVEKKCLVTVRLEHAEYRDAVKSGRQQISTLTHFTLVHQISSKSCYKVR